MANYVGILDGAEDVWGVRIPDVPGCHGGGSTPEAALADAIGALREFATHQASKGVALKPPRRILDITRDAEAAFDAEAGEALVLVPLILDQARPVKANISLDAGLLEAIDEEAQRRGLTRSAFFTSAALDKIDQVEDQEKRRSSSHRADASPLRTREARLKRLPTDESATAPARKVSQPDVD